jgi:anti-sigma28 factor (negative regulator of flagellin synthesis)
MIVSNQQVSDVLKLHTTKINRVGEGYSDAFKYERRPINDALSISDTSKAKSIAYQALQKTGDSPSEAEAASRSDKLEVLKTQLAEGRFEVEPDQIAQKILDRLLIDEFI